MTSVSLRQCTIKCKAKQRCWSHAVWLLLTQTEKQAATGDVICCRQHVIARRREYGREWMTCFVRQFCLQTVRASNLVAHLSLGIC